MKLSDLEGSRVLEARLMTEEEQADFDFFEPGVVMAFKKGGKNGTIYSALVQCDPEGNGPGALVVFNNSDENDVGCFGKG